MSGQQSGCSFRWSVLPPLPLRGVGTFLVESAEHYAVRLAWAAGTTLKQVCSLSPPYKENSSGKVGGFARFCGPGAVYRERVSNLERLTGVDTIRCGTFMVLEPVLWPWGSGARARSRGWCPECYAQWDEDISWEPLIWQEITLQLCPIHSCRIVDTCQRCDGAQPFSSAYQNRRICCRCACSLGWSSAAEAPDPRSMWRTRQLEGLIQLCSTPGVAPVPEAALSRFVATIPLENLPNSRGRQIIRDSIAKSKRAGTMVRASVGSIIQLCAIHGVSARDMLLDPIGAASRPLLDNWSEEKLLELLAQGGNY